MKTSHEPTPVTETPVDLDANCEETNAKRYRKSGAVWFAQRMRDRTRKARPVASRDPQR